MPIRAMLASILLLLLGAAAPPAARLPETRFVVTLPAGWSGDAAGRLLLFAEPATADDARADTVDTAEFQGKDAVSVAARDVAGFGPAHAATIDTQETAYPAGFAALPAGDYRVQAVLDRDGDYDYAGRGPGDLVSPVVTVHWPQRAATTIALDRALPPAPAPLDTAGLSPAGVAQVTAARAHLHEEHVASPALTRFRGTPQTVSAWVVTPPGYDPAAKATYPTAYVASGFGATYRDLAQQAAHVFHLMETRAIPPMIWVYCDHSGPTGTTEFADSVNNGPWGEAFTAELIPALEARYRMDARPRGRFLTGHSSGGWFALWAMVRYSALFGGSWPTAPDPSDFHDFVGVDIYAPGANMYRDARGAAHPLVRDHGRVVATVEQFARLEAVLGHDGGQFRSFEWVFSPRRADGTPAYMFDRVTGAVDPAVAAYWRDHWDVAHRIETQWPTLRRDLDGKLHLTVGTADTFYLDGSAHRLDAAFARVGGRADFSYVPDRTHGDLYARGGDRDALRKDIAWAMYAVARPGTKRPAEATAAPAPAAPPGS